MSTQVQESMTVPFFSFTAFDDALKQEYLKKVEALLNNNQFILGKEVTEFEKTFAQYCGAQFCYGVGNGLDALYISLRALDIGAGDEVIVPAHTFVATWSAVSQTGATPVAVDVDGQTYNIDCRLIEERITPKTKAIMPVHLYGQPCDMESIIAIAQKHNLHIVEDFAQSQGATYKGRMTGSFGVVNGTSFYPSKNLGAFGDAGAITTNNEELARKINMLRNYGTEKKYYHETDGINSRLDTMQAILLNIKLRLLDEWNEQRIKAAARYTANLKACNAVTTPFVSESAKHIFHLYVIQIERRDELQNYLQQKGVSTIIHYPIPPHKQKTYRDTVSAKFNLPVTEALSKTVLSLPIYPGITDAEIDYVCNCIHDFFKN